MKIPGIVYHGTNRAFVAYAYHNNGWLGSTNGELWFTPQLNHALEYAW